jgi:hypothetical protein
MRPKRKKSSKRTKTVERLTEPKDFFERARWNRAEFLVHRDGEELRYETGPIATPPEGAVAVFVADNTSLSPFFTHPIAMLMLARVLVVEPTGELSASPQLLAWGFGENVFEPYDSSSNFLGIAPSAAKAGAYFGAEAERLQKGEE